jgi:glucokinase
MSDFNQTNLASIGIEISAKSIQMVCLDPQLDILDFKSSDFSLEREILPQVIDFTRLFINKHGSFERIGVAVSGLIDQKTNRVRLSMRNPQHVETDLAGEIKNALGIVVVLENDANAAAFGEFKLGSGRGSQNMFFAMLGEGVGGAVILDGKLWRGISGFAGEIGFAVIDSEGTRLEDVASDAGIIRRIRNRLSQDHSSSLGILDEITIEDVVSESNNGDEFAQMMLERTGKFVGMATANVINFLNIERIVFGGSVMKAENFVLDSIIESARSLSFEPCFENTNIFASELQEKSAAIGAALLSINT